MPVAPVSELPVGRNGFPVLETCPQEECDNTEDLMVQECAPGRTWMFTSTACGHWGFIQRKDPA